jgi:hypothetical protein
MTENERIMAQHLAACRFCPGIRTKRFARDMAYIAEHFPSKELSKPQGTYLRQAVVRYRRQIPDDVVAIARMELEQ